MMNKEWKQQDKQEYKFKTHQWIDKELYILGPSVNTDNKIIIDIDAVKNFCFCPYYYDFKQKDQEINMKDLYNLSLHKTFYNYLLALQKDTLKNTLDFLKLEWGKEWIAEKVNKKSDLLVTPSAFKQDTWDNRRQTGIKCILNFDDIMMKDKQFPIVVDHRYQIEILPDVILTGKFEYIRELTVNDNKIVQIVKFVVNENHFTTTNAINKDLSQIAAAYAFNELFEPVYFQNETIDVYNKKRTINIYTERDFNLLKKTINSVIMCLQNNIKCVSPDKKCYHCEYRNECKRLMR